MPTKITILGSCRHSPYEILAKPDPLKSSWTRETHELHNTEDEYLNATKLFYPAIEASDVIIVWAPDGIGEHTQRDIDHAHEHNKRIIIITPLEVCQLYWRRPI